MYVPSYSREQDRDVLLQFVDEYPFATLVTTTPTEPIVTHLPVVLQRESSPPCICGHVALANPHRNALARSLPTLAIFHGPHAYVSPAWYSHQPSVPTWNYAVVHISGRPRLVDKDGTKAILRRLVEKFEANRANRWDARLPDDFLNDELAFIVGFEMAIDKLDGKFKLNQSKTELDQRGTLAGLDGEGDEGSKKLADFTRKYLLRRGGV